MAGSNDYLLPREWRAKHRVGHIAIRCIGGCMDGQFIDAGVGARFFRVLSGGESACGNSGYLPDHPVHSYRLMKQATGLSVFEYEGLLRSRLPRITNK